jgi:hypothetical protein
MDEVKSIISQSIEAAGGTIAWDDCLAKVPFEKQRYFMPAIRALEAEGTYKRQVTATTTGATFALVKIGA